MNQYPTSQSETIQQPAIQIDTLVEGHNRTAMNMPSKNPMRHVIRTMVHGPQLFTQTELLDTHDDTATDDVHSYGFNEPFVSGELLPIDVENILIAVNEANDSRPIDGFRLPNVSQS